MNNMSESVVTVKDLRELLDGVPDDAEVRIASEGCCGRSPTKPKTNRNNE